MAKGGDGCEGCGGQRKQRRWRTAIRGSVLVGWCVVERADLRAKMWGCNNAGVAGERRCECGDAG